MPFCPCHDDPPRLPVRPALDGAIPLCSSTHAAVCWSSSTFAGQRPDDVLGPWKVSPDVDRPALSCPRHFPDPSRLAQCVPPPSVPILHASTLIAPVPCARTFLATVFSARG